MKIVIRNDQNEVLEERQLRSKNVIAMIDGIGGTEHMKVGDSIRLDEDTHIISLYQETVNVLRKNYAEYISHISARRIMFEVNDTWEPTEKSSTNSKWKIKVSKTPAMVKKFTGYDYIIKMRQHWIDEWTDAQVNAAIMSQLLRINAEDASILNYTENFHSKLISTFGEGYLDKDSKIPDMLETKIEIKGFNEASRQIKMEELTDGEESREDI